nr:protein transport protein SEC31-like [Aegilops tauschii subsp. strangulata]
MALFPAFVLLPSSCCHGLKRIPAPPRQAAPALHRSELSRATAEPRAGLALPCADPRTGAPHRLAAAGSGLLRPAPARATTDGGRVLRPCADFSARVGCASPPLQSAAGSGSCVASPFHRVRLPHVDSVPRAAPPALGRVTVRARWPVPPGRLPAPGLGRLRVAGSPPPLLPAAPPPGCASRTRLGAPATRPRRAPPLGSASPPPGLAGYSSRRERRGRLCPAGSLLRPSTVAGT